MGNLPTLKRREVSSLLEKLANFGALQLHKLRRAMVRPSREQLGGQVEVDETLIGGPEDRGMSEDPSLSPSAPHHWS